MFKTLLGGNKNSVDANPAAASSLPSALNPNSPSNNLDLLKALGASSGPDPSKKIPRPQLEALSAAPSKQATEGVYTGDPDNQVIVIDGDETLWDDSDKHTIDEKKVTELGRKLETISPDSPKNKHKKEIKYVLRPGVEELFSYLKARGHKIVVCTRNYEELAETIVENNPMLHKYVDGVLGRSDLTETINKDFGKYPKHPDNISIPRKVANFCFKYFWWYPTYPFRYIAAKLSGSHAPRLPAMPGEIGKYTPNMLEMLKAEGNSKFKDCKPPRILIDNKVEYETDDANDPSKFKYKTSSIDFQNSANSDFAVISPNVVRGTDTKEATHFFAEYNEPKVKVKDEKTGEEKEVYLWVKNVIGAIEQGWKAQYKALHGKEPEIAEATTD